VSIVKRFELHYEDELGQRVVPIEPMADGELVVSTSAISADQSSIIKERISAALSFLGVIHRFD
jgi:hypothetical protein